VGRHQGCVPRVLGPWGIPHGAPVLCQLQRFVSAPPLGRYEFRMGPRLGFACSVFIGCCLCCCLAVGTGSGSAAVVQGMDVAQLTKDLAAQRTHLHDVHRLEQKLVHGQFQHHMKLQTTQGRQEVVQVRHPVSLTTPPPPSLFATYNTPARPPTLPPTQVRLYDRCVLCRVRAHREGG
jgi:hypothetical protein